MPRFVIAFGGNADVKPAAVNDLLDDMYDQGRFEITEVIIPSYISSQGMRNVSEWLASKGGNVTRHKKSKIIPELIGADADAKHLVILGTDGWEDEVEAALHCGVTVLDLSRGLFAVTLESLRTGDSQPVLDGPEMAAELVPELPGIMTRATDLVTQVPPEGPESCVIELWPEDAQSVTRESIEEIVAHAIHIHEQKFHPVYVPENKEVPQPKTELPVMPDSMVPDPLGPGKAKYYKDDAGNIRKAGRSKPLQNEALVWLTADEAENYKN